MLCVCCEILFAVLFLGMRVVSTKWLVLKPRPATDQNKVYRVISLKLETCSVVVVEFVLFWTNHLSVNCLRPNENA